MYTPNYWLNAYPNKIGNEDFVEGVIVALFTFAEWKKGRQVIGKDNIPIQVFVKEVHQQLLPNKVGFTPKNSCLPDP